ncbi:hypothetical protein M9Y10_039394 [Tritrichomonas musculus]|uniref:E3 ubiquitin-protein ligase n=1 Tax=Tritrichomonas musculus TaxID=1915356 RepID=A0ABR2KBP6_9EUKA
MDRYKELESLFISDTQKAINESQQIICSVAGFASFSDFYNYHLEHSHISTCQKEWSTNRQMSIHCVDCSISPNSCFCLECFLKSNHQGHEYLIRPNSIGNCDCGDLQQWKRAGFCPKHQGLEEDSHPENYLDEKLRTVLTDTIFKAAFSSLTYFSQNKKDGFSLIIQFLISFLKFGDGFRRLLVISFTERANIDELFDSIFKATEDFNEELKHFCGLLINDQLFKNNFSKITYRISIESVMPMLIGSLISTYRNPILKIWDSFWFHGFSISPIRYNIDHYNWDWVEYGIKFQNFLKNILSLIGKDSFNSDDVPDLFLSNASLHFASECQPNERTQNFFDRFFSETLTKGTTRFYDDGHNNTLVVTSFKEDTNTSYYEAILYFNYFFFENNECFKSKENLKFDGLFEILDKTIDISHIYFIGKNLVGSSESNENEKFISYLISNQLKNKDDDEEEDNEDNFKSFHNGASFYISHPMFYSVLYLFRNDEMCRTKMARLFSLEKYQSLRVRLGILALKNFLALLCLHQSLVPGNNSGAAYLLSIYINIPSLVSSGIPLIVPFLQLLIGIQSKEINGFCLKEFFAFEMAREIGIFDDFTTVDYEDENAEVKQKQMIFAFLYCVLLFVVERTLYHFNGFEFIKEQIIFGLKKGISNLNQLKDMFDLSVTESGHHMSDFNKIIVEVANARQKSKQRSNENEEEEEEDESDDDENSGKQDVSFDLKETVEFKKITAINSINDEKVIMNNEISKNPEKLLKIQDFEPEETFFFKNENDCSVDSTGLSIRLKDLLMTPTVIAIVYHTLRNTSEKVELNEHLAMNILLLISKFIQEDDHDESSQTDLSVKEINYDSTIVDLISKLKENIFDYKVDENGKATIQNTLSKKVFNSLLKIKISSENQSPKSFIEILLEKGEIGKTVLDQMSIEIEAQIDGLANQKEKQDVNKMKKIRANKLKEDIMNHFKTITANFNDQNDENLTLINSEVDADVCSICSTTKKDELLCFPLFLYRTKFPFIIDKPPLVKLPAKQAFKEVQVFEDEEILSDDDDDEEEEEEEEDIPDDPEEMFARFLQDHPDFMEDDMSEQTQRLVETIHLAILETHAGLMERREERRRKREERQKLKIQKKKEKMEKKVDELNDDDDTLVEKMLTPGNLFVIQFGICQHLIHPECVDKKRFNCPIDRSFKNGFLPNIDDLKTDSIFVNENNCEVVTENLTDPFKNSLTLFIDNYSSFFRVGNDRTVDVFVELVKSISGLISTYEIRLRSLPGSLDSKKNKLLSRNLFLTSWYSYRMKGKPDMKTDFIDVDSKLSVFQRFIKKLIECDEILHEEKESLKRIVSSFISSFSANTNERSEKELFLFLRRVYLVDHFLLSNGEEQSFIDWDELLSIESLSAHFNVAFNFIKNDFEFKPFIFAKLPKEFIRFGEAPYNFPVDQTHNLSIFNLLNYNLLIQNYDDFDECIENDLPDKYMDELKINSSNRNEASFIRAKYSGKNYPSVLLYIGSKASSLAVFSEGNLIFLRPFYLDRYGCADIGYVRNQPLFLNEDRYDRFMDEVLSGDFSFELEK